MVTQLLPDPAPGLRRRHAYAMVRDDKGRDHFSVSFVWQAHHADFRNGRVAEEAVLDLERVDVFAALDDDVLDASGNLEIAVCVHFGFVARLEL